MPCELSFHPAQAIPGSHRPGYWLELLEHGEMWALLTALSWVSCTPNPCSTMCWGLASVTAFLRWLRCSGQAHFPRWFAELGCPVEDPGAAGSVETQGGHQARHGACCSEIKRWSWDRKQGPARKLQQLLWRGRLRAPLEEQTWKIFLVAGVGSEHLQGFLWYSYQVQDQHFYRDPSKHTVQTAQVDTCAPQPLLAVPTHRTLGASQIRMDHWAGWCPRGCWRSLGTDTDSLAPGPQWRGTCPMLKLPTAARPASLCFTVGEKEGWRKQSQYVN